jgi:hypothetical protein
MIAKSSFPDGANDVTHRRKREKVTVVVPGVENGLKTLGIFFSEFFGVFGFLDKRSLPLRSPRNAAEDAKKIRNRLWFSQRALRNFFAHSAVKRFGF